MEERREDTPVDEKAQDALRLLALRRGVCGRGGEHLFQHRSHLQRLNQVRQQMAAQYQPGCTIRLMLRVPWSMVHAAAPVRLVPATAL